MKPRWKTSTEWAWVSMLALATDYLLYDTVLAVGENQLYVRSKGVALWIHKVRSWKQAEFQE